MRAPISVLFARISKSRTGRVLNQEFPELKKWCGDHLWAPGCCHGSVVHGWEVVEKYIAGQDRKPNGRDNIDRVLKKLSDNSKF